MLATGTYILQGGISVSGQANLSSQSGAPGTSQGVLLYVTGGSINFSGQGYVSLAPLSNPSPYPVIAPNLGIWQDKSDTKPVIIAGNASGNIYSGTIYAPTASVGGSGNGSYTAGSVIASSLTCSGNGTETIG